MDWNCVVALIFTATGLWNGFWNNEKKIFTFLVLFYLKSSSFLLLLSFLFTFSFFRLQESPLSSKHFSINLSILSADVGYPPVSTQFIFDPVTSPRIKVTFDSPFDWPVINQFKHITNKYICEISKANHRWNPKVVNLLDSSLHKIFPNMLVPQHNRFRNLPLITNNNFVH